MTDPNFKRDRNYESELFETESVTDIENFIQNKVNSNNIFRGQANPNWILQTGIDRLKQELLFDKKETSNFLYEKGKSILDKEHIMHNGYLNTKAKLQHLGAPTDLIDFTKDVRIALYFALSAHYHRLGNVPDSNTKELNFSIYELDKEKIKDINKLVIIPTENGNDRMVAQKGVLFGFQYKPTSTLLSFLKEKYNKNIGIKYIFTIKDKKNLRQIFCRLYISDIHHSALFPDLHGELSGLIEDYYFEATKRMCESNLYSFK